MARTILALLPASLVGVLLVSCGSGGGSPDRGPARLGDARIVESSPFDGEEGVAVTREAVLRFDAPVVPASIRDDSFWAEARGQRLPARIHVAADGRSTTLFFEKNIVDSEVSLYLDGDRARSAGTGRPIDGDGDGRVGGRAVIRYRSLDLTVVPNTDVCGRVFASELGDGHRNVPLVGVSIRVDGLPDKLTQTDSLGNFCLRDVPAGRIFVHVDGSTAADPPAGFFYPNVGKTWQTKAGQRVEIGTVHLPAVAKDSLVAVSEKTATEIGFSDSQLARMKDAALRDLLRDVKINVPPASLFADDGKRGGRVGIAPVDPSRLPGRLPASLPLSLVITIQTDGATNFGRPVPVRFPNLPDPVTKKRLEPGAKSALWSFNHDSGYWEVVGPMTVSDDGKFVVSDPGVGIRAPGWHGSSAGSNGDGAPPGDGPNDDGDDEPCKNQSSWWDWFAIWAKLSKDIAGCAADLIGLRGAWACLKRIHAAVADAIVEADKIAKIAAEQAKDPKQIADWVARAAKLKVHVLDLYNCTKTINPAHKVLTILTCAKAVLSAAEALCKSGDKCPKRQANNGIFCKLVEKAKFIIDQVQSLAKEIEALSKEQLLKALCKRIERLIKLIQGLQSGTAPAGTTWNEVIAEAAEMRKLAEAASLRTQDADQIEPLSHELLDASHGMNRAASHGIEKYGVLAKRRLDYALEILDADLPSVSRGQTAASGRINVTMAADANYRYALYDWERKLFGASHGRSAAAGRRTRLERVALLPIAELPDSDGDGLVDEAERVYGTLLDKQDSDGDGMSDGDEVHSGRDPLDGIDARVRIVTEVELSGPALDISVAEGNAVLALGAKGVEVVNTYQGMEPARIATIDTPGTAQRVACGRFLVAVADGSSGLTILDLRKPTEIRVLHRLSLGSVTAVAAAGELAVAGTSSGAVHLVDMVDGFVVSTGRAQAVRDLAWRGERIYALGASALASFRIGPNLLVAEGSVATPRTCTRLHAGVDHLFAAHRDGFVRFSVESEADAKAPRVVSVTDTAQRGWRQIVSDASGYGLAVSGLNSGYGLTDGVQLYDIQKAEQPGRFLRHFDELGFDEAIVSALALDNGLAYVADRRSYGAGKGKLRVLRYVMRDLGNEAPAISIVASPGVTLEEGKYLWLRARTQDDVLVRNVDFYVDDVRLVSDGNAPFDLLLPVPPYATTKSVRVHARAWDSGGNATSSASLALRITPDRTAPELALRDPGPGAWVAAGRELSIRVGFSERVAPASISKDALKLVAAGDDGKLGTGDDEQVAVSSVRYVEQIAQAIFLSEAIPVGPLRCTLAGIQDAAGNRMPPQIWELSALEGLRMRTFGVASSADLRSFFAQRSPDSFTLYRANASPVQVSDFVIPSVDFHEAYSGWMHHAGADGRLGNRSPSSPVGDDFGLRSAGYRSGALVEGAIAVPETGDYTFSIDIDDIVILEIADQILLNYSSGSRRGVVTAKPIRLAKGSHRLRLAFADNNRSHIRCRLLGRGPGLTGGVVPPAFFRSGK